MRSMNQNHDLTDGPLLGRIIAYTVPLMLTGILQLLYNAADSVVVGKFVSAQALAAVGSTGALINLTINLFLGMSVGVSIMIAQQIGAQRHQDVSETVHTAVVVSVLAGAVVGVFGFCAARTLLLWMDSPADVIELSTLYTKIYFIGMPANLLYNFGASVLRAAGDTKRPLLFLTVSGLVNVVLNVILVVCFSMGVAGVAIATVVSQVLSAALVVLSLMHSDQSYRLELRALRIHGDKLARMIRLGLPAGLQGATFSVSNILIQSSINSFGSLAMAGNTAAGSLDNFIYISTNAVYHTAVTFTGQNVGAKRYDRLNRITGICLGTATVIGVAVSVIIFVLRVPLLHLYNDDPQVIQYALLRMDIMCLTYVSCGWMDVMCGQLRGMGESVLPLLTSIIGVCGIRILWIYTIFRYYDHSLTSLYISYPVSWVATTLAHCVCYRIAKRRLERRKEPVPDGYAKN